MRRLSSSLTIFYKRILPGVWFALLAAFLAKAVLEVVQQPNGPDDSLFAVGFLLGLGVFGYLMFRAFLFDLVDAVYLDSDELLVRDSGVEDRFPLANILNVRATQLVSPDRITLTLREPCKFGSLITFTPPMRLLHFGRHPVAKELMRLTRGGDELRAAGTAEEWSAKARSAARRG
jgi:hypothetical protein